MKKKLSLPAKIRIGYNIFIFVMLLWIVIAYFTKPAYHYWQNEAFKASWRATEELFKF